MTEIVLRGGRVVDETGERLADVRVVDGVIAEVGPGLSGGQEVDASGCLVTPGLVDLHAHLREPGMEEAETVETGARAAALGGYTAVVAMPNTEPALDSAALVGHVLALGAAAPCDVRVAGAITRGRAGSELAPLGEMYDLGVRIFTDDGDCVADPRVFRRALDYARALPGAVIADHCEEPSLVDGGLMNEGEWSSRLGVAGRPAVAEDVIVARDLALARATGGRLHLLHLSTADAIEAVRTARSAGIHVTAEATPHHLVLTDEACATWDPAFKVHPPLRTGTDVAALRQAVADGVVDAIATDHAPHPPEEKDQPFGEAPSGMLGLETALAVVLTELVAPGVLSMAAALDRLSTGPAKIAGLQQHGRPVAAGEPANLCCIDPDVAWEVDAAALASRARNTPWAGRKLNGKVRHTLLFGEPVVLDGEAQR
ncbi:MAG: dihydroorotase [Actinobacteria bacterium]|nr:dihydroorotase [Actinomycetota bacterium]